MYSNILPSSCHVLSPSSCSPQSESISSHTMNNICIYQLHALKPKNYLTITQQQAWGMHPSESDKMWWQQVCVEPSCLHASSHALPSQDFWQLQKLHVTQAVAADLLASSKYQSHLSLKFFLHWWYFFHFFIRQGDIYLGMKCLYECSFADASWFLLIYHFYKPFISSIWVQHSSSAARSCKEQAWWRYASPWTFVMTWSQYQRTHLQVMTICSRHTKCHPGNILFCLR